MTAPRTDPPEVGHSDSSADEFVPDAFEEDSATNGSSQITSVSDTSALRTRLDRIRHHPMATHLAVLALFLVFAALVVGTNVHRSPGMAIFDETTHADYAYRISHGNIPAKGGVLAPEIRREAACHGKSISIITLPPCNLAVVPPATAFAVNGEDYNFSHPPVYYLITGYLARIGGAIVGSSGHFITLARLVGIGWLASAMFMLYLALLKFRVPRMLAITGGLLLVACPSVSYASSIITNDAAAALGGAIALYFMGRALGDGSIRPIPLAIWAALVTGTKVINALPFLGLAGLFAATAVVAWRKGDRIRAKSNGIGASAIVIGVFIVYKGWSVYQSHRGVANWVNPVANISGRAYHGLPFDEWAGTLFSGFPPDNEYFLPAVLNNQAIVVWQRVLPVVTGAAVLGLVIVFRRGDYRWQLGATLIGALLAFPILVQIQVFTNDYLYFPVVVSRYGMSLIPWCIAAIALIAAWRPFIRSYVAFTLLGLTLVLSGYLGI